MTEKHPFIRWCLEHKACSKGIKYVRRFRSPADWWKRGCRPSYMAWFVLQKEETWSAGYWCVANVPFYYCAQASYDGPSLEAIRAAYPQCPWDEATPRVREAS